MSSGQAIAITLSPPHRVGLATSTFFSLTDGGVGIGPLFLGLLVPSIGFRGLYMLMAGGAIFSMFLYYLLHGRKKRQQESVVIN
jgi:MFS family permease